MRRRQPVRRKTIPAVGLGTQSDSPVGRSRLRNLVNYNRIGFDVLNIRLVEENGKLIAHTVRLLDRLGRPLDLCVSGGKLYIVEYCRQNETAGPGSEGYKEGGRVLEVSARR